MNKIYHGSNWFSGKQRRQEGSIERQDRNITQSLNLVVIFDFPVLRSSLPEVSAKTVLLEISQNSHEITRARVSFLMKLHAWGEGVSCEFCEISKNTFFYRRAPQVTASEYFS